MYYINEVSKEPKEFIEITDYCNVGNDYKPLVKFNLTYSDVGFHAHFDVYESNPRAVYTSNFEEICRDSCVEWFAYFAPGKSNRYFNFEVNANGAMDVSFRVSRDDYINLTEEDVKDFDIKTSVKDNLWTVDYTIPFTSISKYIDGYEFKKDSVIMSNVYKCGDDTEFKHFGCWSMVDPNEPDFHDTSYFKEMKIV